MRRKNIKKIQQKIQKKYNKKYNNNINYFFINENYDNIYRY